MRGEIRNPKVEGRKKSEIRRPKNSVAPELSSRISLFGLLSAFGFRPSDFSRSHSWFSFVNDANDHPADRTFFIADGFARRSAVARDDYALVQAGPMGVDCDLRNAFRFAHGVDWLTDEQSPPLQAWVLAGRNDIAFDAS
jgi:hypothetical protein